MTKFIIKRGPFKKLPKKFDYAGELFYITDANILGVSNSELSPQLLVNIIEFDNKSDFPEKHDNNTNDNSKLYYDKSERTLYYFDILNRKYGPIQYKLANDIMTFSLNKL